ncbi:DUF1385 domain-containing protein [Iamia sp. SCSIO 61187]|uniref:DUF1385 domain-containing protein n=1 Tax=Iamia sp. SCSIO 61187 TaxID=2722752 RepID=UPI001C629674|nr:DUF1385 domain-containing protein [Iamia sp. SCSIO 61187]QYG91181.1 DUF1385 domain-containing protein [Iamia sp. SCSIO 61187]
MADTPPTHPTPDLLDDIGPIGGQALIEGVMMRRAGAWGAAVRRADGTIATTGAALPDDGEGVRRIPLLRGPVALWESVSLGTKAMIWGAQERGTEDGRGYSKGGLALTTVIAAVLAIGILGLLPAVLPKALGIEGRWLFNATESAIRLSILVGYMWLLSLNSEVKRTFAYHGAEHMTIHAFEHGVALEPAEIRRFDRRHPRCGTAFLLIVVLVSLIAHVAVGEVSWPVLVASRVLGLPVVAGVAYEVIRLAGLRRHSVLGRVLMAPGSWLQTLTTQPPDDDQIEVAVAALHATLAAEAAPAPAAAPVGASA